jgi:small conductance mechanosensitive channel
MRRLGSVPIPNGGDPKVLGVDELGDSAVVIRMTFTTDPGRRSAVKREFLRRVKYRLDEEGIEIAYPHLQIVQGGDQS